MSLSSGTGHTGPADKPPPAQGPAGPAQGAAGPAPAAGAPALTGEPRGDDLAHSVSELHRLLARAQGLQDFLAGVAALAARLLPGHMSCGMAIETGGKPVTAACSDDIASQVDEVHYLLDEGPCPDALRQRRAVRVDDTATATAWPGFAPRAAAYGIRSCLCLPLAAGGRVLGALNLYATSPRAFGPAETRRAEEFARHASDALAVATRLAAYTALTDQLRASLVTRAAIDQALGVIMARRRCNQAEAFGVLRAASQRRNVKLRELAREIVAEVSGEPPQPPPFAPA